jgi:VCBS repeat-containing protein
VAGNATIEYNGSTAMPGGIDISALLNAGNVTFDSMLSNGGTAVLQWTYHPINADLDFLHAGDVLKIKFVAEVSDGHGQTGSQPLTITLVGADSAANAANTSASGPMIETDAFAVTELDSFGPTDPVHFIFNEGGTGPDVTLTGTSGKDVIFATGHADTLTGGMSADQFVFAPETSPSADTITDFKPGEDHIDLRAF